MTIPAGTKLGSYEILEPLGAGGMGEVYKARDTRLNRTVAVKVLPDYISASPEAKVRFEREARTIAGLKHPHICVLYDVGTQDGIDFLVMEHLEGETLAERLTRGPIPLPEALRIAEEIAGALDAAHRSGAVHRDLKPGNIMLTKDGAKLLDFGLAKTQPVADFSASVLSGAPTAPTISGSGAVLGTLQYMAPEQLDGQDADARTDIFAFGSVLYEMLTGKKAFVGKSNATLISAIISSEPLPLSTVLPGLPPQLDRVIARCLAKDPAMRWHSIPDLLFNLKWALDPASAARPSEVSYPRRMVWLTAALGALALISTISAIALFLRPAPEAPSIRFEIPALGDSVLMSISPDGQRVVYVAPGTDGRNALWIRQLGSLDAQMLQGTEGAGTPDWSPRSDAIVFNAEGKLKKISVSGGLPTTLADLGESPFRRSAWNLNGDIVFGTAQGIRRIAESGGTVTPLTEVDQALEEQFHATPSFLPDGRHFLFVAWSANPQHRVIYIGDLDPNVKPIPLLTGAESKAVYASPGFVLYMHSRTLMARPFDAGKLRFTGEAIPLVENVSYIDSSGAAAFSVSNAGTLIYRNATPETGTRQWTWVDRGGTVIGTLGPAHNSAGFRFSRDGDRLVFAESVPNTSSPDIFVYDVQRTVRTRLTTNPAADVAPIWSGDSAKLFFRSNRGQDAMYEEPSSGASPEEVLKEAEQGTFLTPLDASADGRYLVFSRQNIPTPGSDLTAVNSDIEVLHLHDGNRVTPYMSTIFDETQAALSPNGRWLAYVSNSPGTYQVIIQSFPDPSGAKWQVSTEGGSFPRWSRDGHELYYLDFQNRLVAVPITEGSTLQVGRSIYLFDTRLGVRAPTFRPQGPSAPYDVLENGDRFLFASPTATNSTPISVMLNWHAALAR